MSKALDQRVSSIESGLQRVVTALGGSYKFKDKEGSLFLSPPASARSVLAAAGVNIAADDKGALSKVVRSQILKK